MRSILTVMAIESIAPQVRTVVEVNNPAHVEHFRRANADEILVTSRIASRLLARSSLYPGLAELVTDIVSGGEGSELYRVALPDSYIGLSVDELSAQLRAEHSRHPAGGRPRRPRLRQPADRLPPRSSATTPWWWRSRSARSSRWTPTTPSPAATEVGGRGDRAATVTRSPTPVGSARRPAPSAPALRWFRTGASAPSSTSDSSEAQLGRPCRPGDGRPPPSAAPRS